ncbi:MAG: SH3 domain-containing protein [Candidatus Binatia bacterium]
MLRSFSAKTLLMAAAVSAALTTSALAQRRSSEEYARERPGDFVINRPAKLYSGPSADAKILRELRPRTVVRVVEVRDQWYKIGSQSGNRDGYIRRSYADPFVPGGGGGGGGRMRFKVGIFRMVEPAIVREQPNLEARKIATLREGAEVRIVDKQGNWYRVESESGRNRPGWIPTVAARRLGDVEER